MAVTIGINGFGRIGRCTLAHIVESARNDVQVVRINAPDQTRVVGRMVRVLAWYDNEWGFSARMADVAAHMGRLH